MVLRGALTLTFLAGCTAVWGLDDVKVEGSGGGPATSSTASGAGGDGGAGPTSSSTGTGGGGEGCPAPPSGLLSGASFELETDIAFWTEAYRIEVEWTPVDECHAMRLALDEEPGYAKVVNTAFSPAAAGGQCLTVSARYRSDVAVEVIVDGPDGYATAVLYPHPQLTEEAPACRLPEQFGLDRVTIEVEPTTGGEVIDIDYLQVSISACEGTPSEC